MSLSHSLSVARKDLSLTLSSPLFVIFACVFILFTGSITIYTGGFIQRQQADLQALFQFLPWIFVIMMPALAIRSWSEEFQLGTIENLFALPISLFQLTLGKFIAVWILALIVFASSLSFWITINYLGEPDNGVALAGFLGATLLAGAYLSLASLSSALSSSQAVAFILSVALSFFFTALGAPIINHVFAGFLPPEIFSFITSFSLLSRFTNISQGILLAHDFLFFLSFITAALALTALALAHRRKAPLSILPSLAPALAVLVLFALFNLALSHIPPLRIDLSQQKIFTLSPSSEKLVKNLKKPITVTFYYSQKLNELSPSYALFASRVTGLLKELDALGGDNLSVQFVNPLPFDASEDDALKNGLKGIPLDDNSKVYVGISVKPTEPKNNNKTKGVIPQGVIPLLQPDREPFIEYDIVKIIAQTQQEQQPKIGVISPLPIFGAPDFSGRTQGSPPWIAFEQASDLFKLDPILNPEDVFNQSWNLIILVHPKNNMPPRMIYALDQYLLRGGSLLVFADPLSEVQPSHFNPQDKSSLNVVNTLLKPTGVSIKTDFVLGDKESAVMVNTGDTQNPRPLPHVAWLRLNSSHINPNQPSLAQINDLLVPTPGIISIPENNPQNLSFTSLVSSSENAVPLPIAPFNEDIPDLQKLYNIATNPQEKTQSYPLAIHITGSSVSAFPNGLPAEKNPEENLPENPENHEHHEETSHEESSNDVAFSYPEPLSQSLKPFSVTLVADVDMLRDRFWVQSQNLLGQRIIFPQNDNGSWLLNLLEVSSDNILLLGLRGRGHTSRPFTRFQKLQQEANLLFLDKEQQLQKKINEAEQQLQQLDNEAQNAPEANSQENQKNRDELIQQFTQNLVDTRQQLRQVRFQLRENQERLESLIVFFNIGFLPLLVLMCAAIVAWIRKYKAPGVSKRPAAS